MVEPEIDGLIEYVVDGIKKSTRTMLDVMGITIHMSKMPSWPRYERTRDRLSEFTARPLLYRLIRPFEWRCRRLAFQAAQAAVQMDLINETLRRGEELIHQGEADLCQP